jgi:branched-chain amino acid transport system permease protein
MLVSAIALLIAAADRQQFGNAWVRIVDTALLYVLLALGLNIVVGYAGLLDLGYVAFYAVGAYMFALLASPHLTENFPWIARCFPTACTCRSGSCCRSAALAGLAGVLLGSPTLKLRGDYLAIVTLGFGEIIRVFLNNLEQPLNITNGPRGIGQIDSLRLFGFDLGKKSQNGSASRVPSVTNYYYLFLALVILAIVICHRLERSRASGAPGWRSARTRSRPRPWASTRATEAARVRHGSHVRRRRRRVVRDLPGLRFAESRSR